MTDAKPCSHNFIRICLLLLCGLFASQWQRRNILVAGSPTPPPGGLILEKGHEVLDEGASITSPIMQYDKSAVADTLTSTPHADQKVDKILHESPGEDGQPERLQPHRAVESPNNTEGGSYDFGQKSGKSKELGMHSEVADMSQSGAHSSSVPLGLMNDQQSHKGVAREKAFAYHVGYTAAPRAPKKMEGTGRNVILPSPQQVTMGSGPSGQQTKNLGLNSGLSGIPGQDYLTNQFEMDSGHRPLSYHGQVPRPGPNYLSSQFREPMLYQPEGLYQQHAGNYPAEGYLNQVTDYYTERGYPQHFENYPGQYQQYAIAYPEVGAQHQVPQYNMVGMPGGIPSGIPVGIPSSMHGGIPGVTHGGIHGGITESIPYGYALATSDHRVMQRPDWRSFQVPMDDHVPIVTWVPKHLLGNPPFQEQHGNLLSVTQPHPQHPIPRMNSAGYNRMSVARNGREVCGSASFRENNFQHGPAYQGGRHHQSRGDPKSRSTSVKHDKTIVENRASGRAPQSGNTNFEPQEQWVSKQRSETFPASKESSLVSSKVQKENLEASKNSYPNLKQAEVVITNKDFPSMEYGPKGRMAPIPEAKKSEKTRQNVNKNLNKGSIFDQSSKFETMPEDTSKNHGNMKYLQGHDIRKVKYSSGKISDINLVKETPLEKQQLKLMNPHIQLENEVSHDAETEIKPTGEEEFSSGKSSVGSSDGYFQEEIDSKNEADTIDVKNSKVKMLPSYKEALLKKSGVQIENRSQMNLIKCRKTPCNSVESTNIQKQEKIAQPTAYDAIKGDFKAKNHKKYHQFEGINNLETSSCFHVGPSETELGDKSQKRGTGQEPIPFTRNYPEPERSDEIHETDKTEISQFMGESTRHMPKKDKHPVQPKYQSNSVFDQPPKINLKNLQEIARLAQAKPQSASINPVKKKLELGKSSIDGGTGSSEGNEMVTLKTGNEPLPISPKSPNKDTSKHTEGESKDITKEGNILSEPGYVTGYKIQVSSNPDEHTLEKLHFLGRIMQAEFKPLNTRIKLRKIDMDNKLIDKLLFAPNVIEHEMIEYIAYYIGFPEGFRRIKALTRQFEHNLLFGNFSEINQEYRNFEENVKETIDKFEKVFRLEESWPTFSDTSMQLYEDAKRLLLSDNGNNMTLRVLIKAFIPKELARRVRLISTMAHRWYKEIWWLESELKEALEQGLDVITILLVGDILQFGKTHISLNPVQGRLSIDKVWAFLIGIWDGFKHDSEKRTQFEEGCSWYHSAERNWLLKDPARASVYLSRMNDLRKFLKMVKIKKEDLLSMVYEEGSWDDSLVPWWDAADILSWSEYGLDSKIVANIGLYMEFKPNRFNRLNHFELDRILNDIGIPISEKKIIRHWFKYERKVPETNELTKITWNILSKGDFQVDTAEMGIIKKELFHSEDPVQFFRTCVPYNVF